MDRFFYDSDILDYMVLRPLSHFTLNWELSWDETNKNYYEEEDSFAELLNDLLAELTTVSPPENYHQHEDFLAEHVINSLRWPITKIGKRWVGSDYESVLSQGGFGDFDQENLLKSAAGRIKAARDHGQVHFDNMEAGHQKVLSFVLTIILYHRSHLIDFNEDDLSEGDEH